MLRVVGLLLGFVGVFLFRLLFYGVVLFCLFVGFFIWFGFLGFFFLLPVCL